MSQAEKRLEAMRQNPRADWSIADVQTICRSFGVSCEPPSSGSHYTIAHRSQAAILTIPFRRPIKPVYIKSLVAYIDAVRAPIPMRRTEYAVVVEPLPLDEGGGYVAFVPDLPGCMSDGETDAEALANVHDAIEAWIAQARKMGRAIPPPTQKRSYA